MKDDDLDEAVDDKAAEADKGEEMEDDEDVAEGATAPAADDDEDDMEEGM